MLFLLIILFERPFTHILFYFVSQVYISRVLLSVHELLETVQNGLLDRHPNTNLIHLDITELIRPVLQDLLKTTMFLEEGTVNSM